MNNMWHFRLASILLASSSFCALAGCGTKVDPSTTKVQAAEPQADKPAADVPAAKVELKTANWEQALELVAQQKGKIVVLDLWSTSCPPCVKEFPELVKLQQQHPAEVVCISFNCDYIGLGKPEDGAASVLEFLQEQKAAIHNLLSSDADEDIFKKAKIISLPVVQVIGRDGKLVKQFAEGDDSLGKEPFSYEKHVNPLIAELVQDKVPAK